MDLLSLRAASAIVKENDIEIEACRIGFDFNQRACEEYSTYADLVYRQSLRNRIDILTEQNKNINQQYAI